MMMSSVCSNVGLKFRFGMGMANCGHFSNSHLISPLLFYYKNNRFYNNLFQLYFIKKFWFITIYRTQRQHTVTLAFVPAKNFQYIQLITNNNVFLSLYAVSSNKSTVKKNQAHTQ